jgi:hypothetical protein
MKKIIEIISWLSLVLLVAAPVLFYTGAVSLPTVKNLMLAATVVWFGTALCWMGRKTETAE